MRLFPGIFIVLAILPAYPQAMLEHAAAASGASIGAAGGKVVSNGITAIFGKVDETTTHAAGKSPEKEKAKEEKPAAAGGAAITPAPADGPIGSYGVTPSTRRRHGSSARSGRTGQFTSQAEPMVMVRAAPAPVKEPALQDLLSVQPGTKEQDCITALGTPSSRITIPEEGHMTELLRYSARGQLLGTIRVDNGQVVNIQAVNVSR